jgi:hypothetical protein
MTESNQHVEMVGLGYPLFQLSRALFTSKQSVDAATSQRAAEKVARWQASIQQVLAGRLEVGSRTPLQNVPAWVTLEVLKGGFASGALLAGGALQAHEIELLQHCPGFAPGTERQSLNCYFLSDAGLAQLRGMLNSACYEVTLPEESALLVVAWLLEHDDAEAARQLIATIAPYFASLRFYPVPLAQARRFGAQVHVQTVADTVQSLQHISPNLAILAQQEAVQIWAPFYDRMLVLMMETELDGQFCHQFSPDWRERARALLEQYQVLRKVHQHCSKPDKPKFYFAQLRRLLEICVHQPELLNDQIVVRAGMIVRQSIAKRGAPDSATCQAQRQRQQQDVSAPLHQQIARVVLARLHPLPAQEGLDDASLAQQALSAQEAHTFGLPMATPIPVSIQRKVERCCNDMVTLLLERGLIPSGEVLAQVLPQMSSDVRSAGFVDAALRSVYAATYRAFRNRRSVLLLNLQHQVQIEELPWVAAIERYRSADLTSADAAMQTLREVTLLYLNAFPHAIFPNKLLQELRALAKGANLNIPLVDELAVDIFMGKFSGKFLAAAKVAGQLLAQSLYERYYDIDYATLFGAWDVPSLPEVRAYIEPHWDGAGLTLKFDDFARLCANRAGVAPGSWHTATNGMIIEQQQILTTQNLASLLLGLDLVGSIQPHLPRMCQQCLEWICQRHRMKIDAWHANLIVIKNTACAWRQMVFFLALSSQAEQSQFSGWADAFLATQPSQVQQRLWPALRGLQLARQGIKQGDWTDSGARCFLGWSRAKHWMHDAALPPILK